MWTPPRPAPLPGNQTTKSPAARALTAGTASTRPPLITSPVSTRVPEPLPEPLAGSAEGAGQRGRGRKSCVVLVIFIFTFMARRVFLNFSNQ